MTIKPALIKLHQILSSQFGLDPQRFLKSLRGLPAYLRDRVTFRKGYGGKMKWMPCLHDRHEEGGVTKSEYFWQDLLVARWIFEAAPQKHVDIGSRVDGFVAHVASFREIVVFDVRPISSVVPGVVFRQADLMADPSLAPVAGYCDSLSCLHALEHFGLGRYGDPIDQLGYKKGVESMAMILHPGGVFYLSTPIGKERVEFNANWIFDPRTIVAAAKSAGLVLKSLTVFSPEKGPTESALDEDTLQTLARQSYNLGIFIFRKANTQ